MRFTTALPAAVPAPFLGRRRFLGSAAVGLAAARLGMLSALLPQSACAARAPGDGELGSLARATGWLNSPPLTAAALRGKGVLVQVWTYTCINWLRTLPYVRAWSERYKDAGLTVIGVHSPEFSFEHDLDNVRRATSAMHIPYPVAIDNDFAIWRAFDNNYWPALYLLDGNGAIRHHQFGEGEYAAAERVIQQLLTEAGARDVPRDVTAVEGRGAEAAPDWDDLKSPENYVGYARTEHFASPGGVASDARRGYTAPSQLRLNQWALVGDWTMQRERVASNASGGRIACQFHARDLHLVMRAADRSGSVPFRIRLDGAPPGAAHGADVDDAGAGVAAEPRLYQLVRQPGPIGPRRFEIEFLAPGAEAFAFTFG